MSISKNVRVSQVRQVSKKVKRHSVPKPSKSGRTGFQKVKGNSSKSSKSSKTGFQKVNGDDLLFTLSNYISDYIYINEPLPRVIASWVLAAHLIDCWDRFPYLGLASPEKRCGKTTLLELLYRVVPNPYYTGSITPSAIYRLVEAEKPTLLMDESQSLSDDRIRSEQYDAIRGILNAGIAKDARVTRCGGQSMSDIVHFNIYSPKVFALIGKLNHVIEDRSITIELSRKPTNAPTKSVKYRELESTGDTIKERIEEWKSKVTKRATNLYIKDHILPELPTTNDRMKDLLLPLQVVTKLLGESDDYLYEYAEYIEERGTREDSRSIGVRLLEASRSIMKDSSFISTADLLLGLHEREGEPWATYSTGRPMTSEALACILRKYAVRPVKKQTTIKGKQRCIRGYLRTHLEREWNKYLAEHEVRS